MKGKIKRLRCAKCVYHQSFEIKSAGSSGWRKKCGTAKRHVRCPETRWTDQLVLETWLPHYFLLVQYSKMENTQINLKTSRGSRRAPAWGYWVILVALAAAAVASVGKSPLAFSKRHGHLWNSELLHRVRRPQLYQTNFNICLFSNCLISYFSIFSFSILFDFSLFFKDRKVTKVRKDWFEHKKWW